MKGLLIKDFKLLAGQKRFFIMGPAFGLFFMIANGDPASGAGYITMLFTLFTLNTISYDEYDNGMSFLMTLPITRNTYIKEKYVFAGMMVLVSTVIAFVLAIFSAGWLKIVFDWKAFWATGGVMILFVWFTLAVAIPMQMKYGAEKGRIAMLFTGGIIFAAVILLAKAEEYFGIDLSPIVAGLEVLNGGILFVAAALLALLLILGSYLISTSIIKKKEF